MGTDITKVCSHVLEVVVAIVPGQFHQCGVGRMLAKCHQGRMETVDANIFLGRKAHVFGEDAVELPWANACFSRQVGQASMGATPVMKPTTEPWGQRTCYIADPEGNLIEISSFKEK